jgi:N,N-dimethylformamidase
MTPENTVGMKHIQGYCDRISVKSQDKIQFMVSAQGISDVDAQLVRLIHGDEHPQGPGFKEELQAAPINKRYAVRKQFTQVGSFARVADAKGMLAPTGAFSIFAFIWPTTPLMHRQGILTRWDASKQRGYGLGISADGFLEFWIGDGQSTQRVKVNTALFARCWYLVGASFDPATGEVSLYQENVINAYNSLYSRALPFDYAAHTQGKISIRPANDAATTFLLAGCNETGPDGQNAVGERYNGKIDRCGVIGRVLKRADFDAIRASLDNVPQQNVLAYWDTSAGYTAKGIGDRIVDVGPNKLDALGYNKPVRAMTGYNWNGRDDVFRLAPEQYGGVHFHEDAIIDCQWTPTCEWQIPADLKSGCYALKVTAGEAEEYIPFFVRAAKPKAKIAVLMATASYLAYANEQLSFCSPIVQPIFGRTPVLTEKDIIRVESQDLGLSTYDGFIDGAGVCFSSYKRPILNMRPKYRMALASVWQFPADLSIIAWLEHQGYDYEVLTDEDLHRDGAACLKPYATVIAGTHPEYYSESMMDGTEEYLANGGRLIYMGGNGYYWVVSFSDEEPWCMEVRKGESGSRAWQAMPGEYYNQTEGVRSGLWKCRGRPPQKLVGVGFSTEGFDTSGSYTKMPDAKDEAMSWIFDKVGSDSFGDFGLALGGAAGLELDRYDLLLGTPPHTRLLATSQGLSDNYPRVGEEIYYNFPGQGATQDYQCRADMVYFTTAKNGAVFAPGSIAWASSLPSNNFSNPVSTIMGNVLNAFLREGPLPE